MKVADGFEPGAVIGPLIDTKAVEKSPKAASLCCTPRHCTATPFDGHTLGPVIAELEALTGVEIRRIHVDKGYRGHNHAQTGNE